MAKASQTGSKAGEILAEGQRLLQTRGYAGFSFRDIAAAVNIRSASIHYHFPTKADLACAVTRTYRAAFSASLNEATDGLTDTGARLQAFASLFDATLVDCDRLCLCGMLATEAELLPDAVRTEVGAFFAEQTGWLEQTLAGGVEGGELPANTDCAGTAALILSALEGGMILARSQGRPSELQTVIHQLFRALGLVESTP